MTPPHPDSPLARLARAPARFTLDQAATLTAVPLGGDPVGLTYRTTARLGYPAGEILAARPELGELTLATFGLVGIGGILPRHHTAAVAAELRQRSGALHAFVDLLANRFPGLHVRAGAKYRPTRDPEPAERALAAFVGLGTPHLAERTGVPLSALLFHAGNLAARTRSASRLAAMLSEELAQPVQIEEFRGGWVRLPPTERSRLAGGGRGRAAEGQHAGLGTGAMLGAEAWDPQARFEIRVGPLDRHQFEALLPGTPRHARIMALTRLFTGMDTGFALNPVLAAAAVPPATLGGGARMGWSSWLGAARPRTLDGDEPRFEGR